MRALHLKPLTWPEPLKSPFLGQWHAFKASGQVLQCFHLVHTVLKSLSQELLFPSCSSLLWLQWGSCDTRKCSSSQTCHESQSEMCLTGRGAVASAIYLSFFFFLLASTNKKGTTHTPALNLSLVFQAVIWTKDNNSQPLPPCFHSQNFTGNFCTRVKFLPLFPILEAELTLHKFSF